MKERNPSPAAAATMALLTMVIFAIIILFPAVYNSAHGIETKSANIVPEIGTAEYDAWCERFAEEHGREYGVHDALIATQNGGYLLIGGLGLCFGIFLLIYTVYDLGCWFMDRESYRNRETSEPPHTGKQQAIRTGLYLACAIGFCLLLPIVLHMMQAIP